MGDAFGHFLSAFNEVEQALRRECDAATHVPFFELLRRAAHLPVVRTYQGDLKELGDLRNAITHGYRNDEPLATPNANAVALVTRIRDLLLAPPRLGQLFRRTVYTCAPSDAVADVVKVMFAEDYSQVPVYDGSRFVGLLNTETVTRWVAKRLEADGIIEGEPIASVLTHRLAETRHHFLSERDDILKALMLFEAGFDRGRAPDALLITANGRESERPVGIVTIFDVTRLRP